MSIEKVSQSTLAIGSVVNLDILPPGCTTDNISAEDLNHVVHMERTRVERLHEEQGKLMGTFVLIPEEVPFTASLDQVIALPASE